MDESADMTLREKRIDPARAQSDCRVDACASGVGNTGIELDADTAASARASEQESAVGRPHRSFGLQLPQQIRESEFLPYVIHERLEPGTSKHEQLRNVIDPKPLSRIGQIPENAGAPMLADSVALAELAACIRDWLRMRDSGSPYLSEPASGAALEKTWDAMSLQTHMLWQDDRKFVPDDHVLSRFANVRAPLATALQDRSASGFDKLHANRVDMGSRFAFIAAQKPIASLSRGFWMAVQEENVSLLIDLTNDTDNAGDLHYGPTSKEPVLELESVVVSLQHQENLAFGSIENLLITNSNMRCSHSLRRLKFDAWQDHGVITPEQLIFLAAKAASLCLPRTAIMIHCRAGVGRTGTLMSYMAADDLIRKELLSGECIPVETLLQITIECVMQGRRDRGPLFVQTSAQFRLLVTALLLQHAGSMR